MSDRQSKDEMPGLKNVPGELTWVFQQIALDMANERHANSRRTADPVTFILPYQLRGLKIVKMSMARSDGSKWSYGPTDDRMMVVANKIATVMIKGVIVYYLWPAGNDPNTWQWDPTNNCMSFLVPWIFCKGYEKVYLVPDEDMRKVLDEAVRVCDLGGAAKAYPDLKKCTCDGKCNTETRRNMNLVSGGRMRYNASVDGTSIGTLDFSICLTPSVPCYCSY